MDTKCVIRNEYKDPLSGLLELAARDRQSRESRQLPDNSSRTTLHRQSSLAWTKCGGSYSSPHLATIDGVQQVLLITGAGTTSVTPNDGKQLRTDTWASNSIVQPAITPEGDVSITSQENGTRRIAVAHNASGWSVHERWTSNGLKPYFNDFVVHKGYAYGFDGRILHASI